MNNQHNPKIFISYSWDDLPHQQWVHELVNKLRSDAGVDATYDRFVTQESVVDLNTMMISAFKDYDKIILVMTENYAKKADLQQGGVGFETILSLPILRREPNRLIYIVRHQGDFEKVFPFHLRDRYAIDFSNDPEFDERFEELKHRIYEVPLLEKAPLGDIPQLVPRKTVGASTSSIFSDLSVTVSRQFTDEEKSTLEFRTLKIQLIYSIEHRERIAKTRINTGFLV